jgi:hypothetical protein
MSIENFKNPWARGGPLHHYWLGGEKLLWGEAVVGSCVASSSLSDMLMSSRPS